MFEQPGFHEPPETGMRQEGQLLGERPGEVLPLRDAVKLLGDPVDALTLPTAGGSANTAQPLRDITEARVSPQLLSEGKTVLEREPM